MPCIILYKNCVNIKHLSKVKGKSAATAAKSTKWTPAKCTGAWTRTIKEELSVDITWIEACKLKKLHK